MNKSFDEIFEYVKTLEVFDTHEHIELPSDYDGPRDVLADWLAHYLSSDFISAGMTGAQMDRVRDAKLPLMERYAIAEPYFDVCRYTGYGQAIDLSAKLLYDIDGVHRETVEAIDEKRKAAFADTAAHYRRALRDGCNIAVSVVDTLRHSGEYDRAVVLEHGLWFATKIDCLLCPEQDGAVAFHAAERRFGRIDTLNRWLEICEVYLREAAARGIPGLKVARAYARDIYFRDAPKSDADECFRKLAENIHAGRLYAQWYTDCEDYILHHILGIADELGLAVQIHTGMQEGNVHDIRATDPRKLTNLILKYRNVKFDIFHIGFPYHDALTAMAKKYHNVFIDMCWAHIISPDVSRRALGEWLESVPYNKIFGFGGDYIFVDGVPGHLYIARRNIAKTLAEKVGEGLFSIDRAADIAKAILYDNPAKVFNWRNQRV